MSVKCSLVKTPQSGLLKQFTLKQTKPKKSCQAAAQLCWVTISEEQNQHILEKEQK